jgi:hypothetical protein
LVGDGEVGARNNSVAPNIFWAVANGGPSSWITLGVAGPHSCAVTLEALENFDPHLDRRFDTVKRLEAHRDRIEQIASAKFDIGNIETDDTVMIRAADV